MARLSRANDCISENDQRAYASWRLKSLARHTDKYPSADSIRTAGVSEQTSSVEPSLRGRNHCGKHYGDYGMVGP